MTKTNPEVEVEDVIGDEELADRFNFYFWLGKDGELEDVVEEEFLNRIEKLKTEREDWENVNVT